MSTVSVSHLTKKFSRIVAVDDISFSIEEGSITGFVGPNGAGKTTTIQMMLDLITPSSGNIKIFDKELHSHREEILQRMNFSSPYINLPYNLTVRENLLTFARFYGVKHPMRRIQELADFFDITSLLGMMTRSLSSGQLARVNLTKALLNSPSLLLLDEPTASLDPDIADRTRAMLRDIHTKHHITMLYTSHNMVEVEEMCDRVLFINEGKIVDDGSPRALAAKYGRRDMNEVFLTIARGNSSV
ncbi:ABC transporter ATP-binding protein [Candidatus Uhrbacteria bacterium]|nr:ABC transporter ATP-binding protein [Candidatus Uhrbacteria bacterium]